MALYATEEALEMILAEDFNSGDETDIEEDPSFPLPRLSDQESDSSSGSDDDLPLPPPRRSDELNSDGANPSDPESQPFRSRSSSPPRRGLSSGQTSSLQWEVADSSTDVAPTLPPFTKTHGPRVTLGTEASPLDFFSLFFDDSVLDLLVEETNRLVEYKYYCTKYTYLHTCIPIHTVMQMRESKPCCAWTG